MKKKKIGEEIGESGNMEYIKSWLKIILYMNILLLLCDNLMQKTAYEKYYRFFSGFLLVLCLLKPVIDFAGTEPYFYASFLQKECETAYKKQIEEVAEQYGISVKKVTFRWDSAKEHIRKLEIEGSLKTLQNEKYKKSEKQIGSVQTETVEKIKKIMMQLYNLKKSDIQIEVE